MQKHFVNILFFIYACYFILSFSGNGDTLNRNFIRYIFQSYFAYSPHRNGGFLHSRIFLYTSNHCKFIRERL